MKCQGILSFHSLCCHSSLSSDFLLISLLISMFVIQSICQKTKKQSAPDVGTDVEEGGIWRKPKYFLKKLHFISFNILIFRKRGNPNEGDWFGSDNRKYMLKKNKGGNKRMFRTNSRGSKQKITKTPELLKHDSSSDEPPVRLTKIILLTLISIEGMWQSSMCCN